MNRKKKTSKVWRNRIVGHADVAPDQLLAHPNNWRTHGDFQQQALGGVLDDIGIVQSVIVNKTTGHLVDGHLRVALALRRHQPTIPVVYVELTEAEEAEVLATLDPISALAGRDDENLQHVLAQINTDNADVQALLEKISGQPIEIPEGEGPQYAAQFSIIIDLETEQQQAELLTKLTQEGYKCKALLG